MSEFDRLVGTQLKTMDQLLDLQTKLERYQMMQRSLKDGAEHQEIQERIQQTQQELRGVQEMFEQQTKQIIDSFQKEKFIHN
ncbi:YgaB family protein [Ectobacillus panaciterrae]|uniref:YgaB family protein n=1 Tax=Ectobacillus panaciterrae TaxID=363872 RepID=UPI0003F91E1E|nr:YgaB family protein [Ectobacillus panaciterrae]